MLCRESSPPTQPIPAHGVLHTPPFDESLLHMVFTPVSRQGWHGLLFCTRVPCSRRFLVTYLAELPCAFFLIVASRRRLDGVAHVVLSPARISVGGSVQPFHAAMAPGGATKPPIAKRGPLGCLTRRWPLSRPSYHYCKMALIAVNKLR